MKKLVAIFGLVLSFACVNAQVILIDAGHPGGDISGTEIEVYGLPSDADLGFEVFVSNEGSSDVNLKVRRTEVDVPMGTRNVTCWYVCPAIINSGDEVVQVSGPSIVIVPSDTNKTFFAHHYPDNVDDCALYKYEWIDAADYSIVYASVTVRYIHQTTGMCTASVDDFSKIDLSVYPNPASNNVTLKLGDVNNNMTYEVANLLGQKEFQGNILNDMTKINTSNLTEGIYFVTVRSNGKLVRTEKLVVKH